MTPAQPAYLFSEARAPEGLEFPADWESGELPSPRTRDEVHGIVVRCADARGFEDEQIGKAVDFLHAWNEVVHEDASGIGSPSFHRLCGGGGVAMADNGKVYCRKCGELEAWSDKPSFL